MHSRRRHVISGSIAVLLIAAGGLPAFASADEQERLDAAIEAFEQRMTDAGWVSTGSPLDDDDTADDDLDDEVDDVDADVDEDLASDDAFQVCAGELSALFESDDDDFPGEIARRESDSFTLTPPADATATTEFLSFDVQEQEIAAIALTVDESGADTLESVVGLLGSPETGECLQEAFEAEFAEDMADDDVPVEVDIEVTTGTDLGIGDQDASLELAISAEVFGFPIDVDAQFLMARVDRTLVAITHTVSGEPISDIDPLAELQTLLESL